MHLSQIVIQLLLSKNEKFAYKSTKEDLTVCEIDYCCCFSLLGVAEDSSNLVLPGDL